MLALLIIAPLVFERVHGLEARTVRNDQARSEVMDLAQRGAASQREVIYSVRALLHVVARAYARMPLAPADCNKDLAALTGNVPWIRALSIAGTEGQISCSTDANAIGLNIADRAHFQSALHSARFCAQRISDQSNSSAAESHRYLSRHR